MLRTTKGLFVFDKLTKPKKAWKSLGNLGTILLFLGMIGIVYFMFIRLEQEDHRFQTVDELRFQTKKAYIVSTHIRFDKYSLFF